MSYWLTIVSGSSRWRPPKTFGCQVNGLRSSELPPLTRYDPVSKGTGYHLPLESLSILRKENRARRIWLPDHSSVAQSCPTPCDPMDCSTPGFPVHHQLLELTQTHVHRVSDAIQPSYPLSSPSLPTFNLPKHQGFFFKWVSSSHQVAKVLEFQLQHKSFQWIFRTGFL